MKIKLLVLYHLVENPVGTETRPNILKNLFDQRQTHKLMEKSPAQIYYVIQKTGVEWGVSNRVKHVPLYPPYVWWPTIFSLKLIICYI